MADAVKWSRAMLRGRLPGSPAGLCLIRAVAAAATLTVGVASTAQAETPAPSPYSDEQEHEVSSLSPEDLSALRAGAGWGLAKPAELNGWPGPRHVLDLSKELELTAAQMEEIEKIFQDMNQAARRLGADLIERERDLDAAFEAGDLDQTVLAGLVAKTEETRAELRLTHLQAHLATTPLLSGAQKQRYQHLRGYGGHANAHGGAHHGGQHHGQ
ncbi:MAG: hypothetical protein KTR21_02155 [Rhodobacteraceae bacterium]|nr:hypothetical protein [Paracoccaceae bacterium]